MTSNVQSSRTAIAFSFSASIIYTACSAGFALWPAPTMSFFNAWFHGLSLDNLQRGADPFTFIVFLYGLVSVAVTTYIGGLLYGTAYNWMCRKEGSESTQPIQIPMTPVSSSGAPSCCKS